MTAAEYSSGARVLASRETDIGRIELVAHNGELALRIWVGLIAQPSKYLAPKLSLDGRAGMRGSKDIETASAWLNYTLPAILKAEK